MLDPFAEEYARQHHKSERAAELAAQAKQAARITAHVERKEAAHKRAKMPTVVQWPTAFYPKHS